MQQYWGDQGRPKAPLATQNASQKSLGGDKNKEVGGTKFEFGQLTPRKVIKIVATRCRILSLKRTKFDFQAPLGEVAALSQTS